MTEFRLELSESHIYGLFTLDDGVQNEVTLDGNSMLEIARGSGHDDAVFGGHEVSLVSGVFGALGLGHGPRAAVRFSRFYDSPALGPPSVYEFCGRQSVLGPLMVEGTRGKGVGRPDRGKGGKGKGKGKDGKGKGGKAKGKGKGKGVEADEGDAPPGGPVDDEADAPADDEGDGDDDDDDPARPANRLTNSASSSSSVVRKKPAANLRGRKRPAAASG